MTNETDVRTPSRNTFGLTRRELLVGGGTLAGLAFLSGVPGAFAEATATSARSATPGRRMLGDLEVSSLGLGCMGGSAFLLPLPDRNAMIAVIRDAAERGVTFFDTAETYGPFTNELLVGEALAPFKGSVEIATKFGFVHENGEQTGRESRPDAIKGFVEGSLERLNVEAIDLYYQHRSDPDVPIEDTVGALKDLVLAGKIKHYGLSEASPETIRRAHAVHPVTAVQTQYSLMHRGVEDWVLPTCEELGIGFVPWGPLMRGFLTGRFDENTRFDPKDFRAGVPSLQPDGLRANMALLAFVREWGERKGVTPAQFSLAWLMAQKPWIVPIPGTTNPSHLSENLGAVDIAFTSGELAEIRSGLSAIRTVGAVSAEAVNRGQ